MTRVFKRRDRSTAERNVQNYYRGYHRLCPGNLFRRTYLSVVYVLTMFYYSRPVKKSNGSILYHTIITIFANRCCNTVEAVGDFPCYRVKRQNRSSGADDQFFILLKMHNSRSWPKYKIFCDFESGDRRRKRSQMDKT